MLISTTMRRRVLRPWSYRQVRDLLEREGRWFRREPGAGLRDAPRVGMEQLRAVAALVRARNALDAEIAAVIDRPALSGHLA
ncbi:MAG TPA: hypothetical protein VJ831_03735 [Jatrophihabitantaceae bacterium]|nr:hypothetical protein [Jatrophihabitantaceae bacterium]